MSHAFYNRQWQETMEDLARQIDLENPAVGTNDAGKPLTEKVLSHDAAFQHFATLYIRYLSIFRRLEECFDQILHPQKRRDLKIVLEVVMARLCQVKECCSRFAAGGLRTDFIHLDRYLLDLRMGPEAVEVPVPKYFKEKSDNDEVNKKRDVLEKILEESGLLSSSVLLSVGQSINPMDEGTSTLLVPRLTRDQAIRIIQRNERGRQGVVRARLMKELRDEEMLRKRATAANGGEADGGGGVLSNPQAAATMIQKVFRGHLVRLKINKQRKEEMVFLGMKPPPVEGKRAPPIAGAGAAGDMSVSGTATGTTPAPRPAKYDPHAKANQVRAQRKTRQLEHELRYIESLVELQRVVTEVEGPEMKDAMWEERYQWWIDYKERTGKYPDSFIQFYRERGQEPPGGMPLPPTKKPKKKKMTDEEKKAAEKEKEKKAKEAKAKAAASNAKGKKGEETTVNPDELVGPTHLVNHMLECVNKYRDVWAKLDESENYQQIHDEELAKQKLRPLIREKIQKEVDVRLLSYLDNIRLKVAQRAAALKAKKKKKGKGKKGKKGDEGKGEASRPATSAGADGGETEPTAAGAAAAAAGALGDKDDASATDAAGTGKKKGGTKKGKGKKGGKKKKCCEGEKACAHMPLGDMISLLVKMGLLQAHRQPLRRMEDLWGGMHWNGTEYVLAMMNHTPQPTATNGSDPSSTASSYPPMLDPSMQQLRSVLTESFILPLGSPYVHDQAPLVNSLLLYGPPGSGKTLLSRAIAAESNAVWFDLSPKNLERKLGTKAEIAKLVHMVFHVARELAPAVIYIDEVEKVFSSGGKKKSSSSAGAPGSSGGSGGVSGADVSKLRPFLLTHKAILDRSNRTLVIGNTRVPFEPKIDTKEFNKFFGKASFGKQIFCPLPNYETRLQLWKSFLRRTGLGSEQIDVPSLDIQNLAHVSEGYTAGSIQQAIFAAVPPRRVQKLLEGAGVGSGSVTKPLDTSDFLTPLSKTPYVYRADYLAYVKYTEQVSGETERRRLKEMERAKLADEKAADAKKAPAKKK